MSLNDDRIEELDTLGRVPRPETSRGPRLRDGLSAPAAAVGVLVVATLVLGAGGFRPGPDTTTTAAGGVTQAGDATVGAGTGDTGDGDVAGRLGSDLDDAVKPATEGTDPGETKEPVDEPDPTKDPEPAVGKTNLAVVVRDTKVRLEWTACGAADVVRLKVVRSADEAVRWPAGERDTLIAALEPRASAHTDASPPDGRKSWYRVFAVAEVEGKSVVRCASDVERAFVPGPEPTDKPTPGPTDKPDVAALELAAKVREGHPFLDWSACKAAGFDYYKVVASKDSTVRWPAGDNDWLAAAIGERDVTAFWDKEAPAGKTLWYRVFCVRASDHGYSVLAASPARQVTTPAVDPGPKPEPVALGIEAGVEGSTVWLDWESCDSDGFVYYKVVRAQHDNPSYLPWTDGTKLIGVIENPGASTFEDLGVEPGDAFYYRVQSIGRWNGEKILLGQTRAVRVEIP